MIIVYHFEPLGYNTYVLEHTEIRCGHDYVFVIGAVPVAEIESLLYEERSLSALILDKLGKLEIKYYSEGSL